MSERPSGPAQLVLTASVARRYYLDGRSKTEIADEFALSRFKVARLLEDARASGLVRIDIGWHSGEVDVNLSARLQEAYGLAHAVVVDTPAQDPASLRRQVGRAAAELLTEIVTPDDVLGVGWARTLMDMRQALTSLAACRVVQLTGALSRPDVDESSVDLVRDLGRIAGGPAHYFYAPLIVPDATTAAVLLGQPEVARAFEQFPAVTRAVVGVGSWDPPSSTMQDAVPPAERRELLDLGVRADVSGVLLDAAGAAVEAPLARRTICITADQLRAVPEVLALAYGTEKVAAARAAIVGGFVTALVTHSAFAVELLETA